jgi:hypothetical protein
MLREVVFLPTAQYDENNPWLPNDRGILRIKAALRTLDQYPDAAFVVAGGYANHRQVTYADRMVAYLGEHCPSYLERLTLVFGHANRTNEDIFQSMLLLGGLLEEEGHSLQPSQCQFFFCSEEQHYGRSEATIRTMGFNPVWVDSGADATIYSQVDKTLAEEVVFGKLLTLGPESVEWDRAALKNVATQAAYCQSWAVDNPQDDQKYWNGIKRQLMQLLRSGVYIESPALKPTRSRPLVPSFR